MNRCLPLLFFISISICVLGNEKDSIRVFTLSETIVTGTRTEADHRIMPLTVNVINEQSLKEKEERNILPTLTQEVPGLFVTQRGVMGYGVSTGGSGGIKIRGIGGAPNTDILVLIDGLPQYAGIYGHPIADNYQTMMTERVEVIRGPASMIYGSNAMGGVVNIVTHQPKTDTVLTSLHLQGGSYYSVDGSVTNQVRKGKWSSAVGASYSRTDGHRANMHFDQTNAYLKLGYDISANWQAVATGNVTFFTAENPGTTAAPITDSRFKVLRGMAAVSIENRYEHLRFATSGAIRAYYNGGRHRINEGYTVGSEAPSVEYNHTDLMTGISAYQSVRFFEGNRTTFGFDYQHFGGKAWNHIIASGKEAELVNRTEYDLAGYVDFRQQVTSWLALDAGCRMDWHSRAGLAYAPQGGVSFLLPQNAEIKAIASKGFRQPTLRELYMYAPKNEELKAVSMWNYELSYKQRLLDGRLGIGANVFYLHAKNNIETRLIDGKPRNVNTGELKNAGCEAEIHYNIWKGLSLSANYSFLYMHRPILAAPEHKLNVALRYHHERFRIGSSVQYISGLYTVLATATTTAHKESFLLWDAHLSVRIWRRLWANIKADNLLNEEYEINAGYPMPKTTIMGGVSWTF